MAKTIKKSVLILLICALLVCSTVLVVACDKTVTITFETNGGTAIDAITGKAGEDISDKLPANPEKEGFRFGGWYLDEDFLEQATLPTVMPEKDVIFYAKWTPKQTAKLKLNAGNGGTLAETEYTYYVGDNVAAFVADKAPTPQQGLEFAGWYEGANKLSATRTMPASGLTLTAKYNVTYTLHVYLQDVDGNYPSTYETRSGKGLYLESFTYEPDDEHYTIDNSKPNSITSPSLDKGETFTVYLARKQYMVSYYINDGSSASPVSFAYRYGETVEVANCAFRVPGYRFAAWTLTSTVNTDSKYYLPGDTFKVEGDCYFYAQWDRYYADMFGGMDYIYIPRLQNGVAILDRYGVGEKKGTYDKSSSTFDFEISATEHLTGKIVGGYFYYYMDTLENVYNAYDGSDSTLEMLAKGKAVYTVDGKSVEGYYDLDESGLFVFSADNLQFLYRLEVVENEIVFHVRGDEEGYYAPGETLSGYGVLLYYLDGFGAGIEYYADYAYEYYGFDALEAVYSVLNNEGDYVVYTLASYYGGEEFNSFDFRINSTSSVVDGVLTNGTFAVSDGYVGEYPHRYQSGSGDTIVLDGFGGGYFGSTPISYQVHTEQFLIYDQANEDIVQLYDVWISFRVGATNYQVRLYQDDEEFYYNFIKEEVFGTYTVQGGYEYNGKTYKALIYSYAGVSEANQIASYAVLLIQIEEYEGVSIYQIVDENRYFELKADENGVYTFSKYKTQFRIVREGAVQIVSSDYSEENKPLELVFFDNEDGKLEISYSGIATYTPVNGQAQTVEYVREKTHGYYLVALYTFADVNGQSYVFAVLENTEYDNNLNEYIKIPYAVKITEMYDQVGSSGADVRMIIYDEQKGDSSNGDAYENMRLVAIGIKQEDGLYNYDLEGYVSNVNGNKYHFTSYNESDLFSDDYLEFDLTISGNTFTMYVGEVETSEYSNENGDKLVFDGKGGATYTKNGEQAKAYSYESYLGYSDGLEDVVLLYKLTGDDENDTLIVKIYNGNQFKFVNADDVYMMYDYNALKAYNSGDTFFYVLLLDGDGVAYFLENTGYVVYSYVGTYKYLGKYKPIVDNDRYGEDDGFDEFEVSINYEYGAKLEFKFIYTVLDDKDFGGFIPVYLVKDETQTGEYNVVNGGSLRSGGYVLYEWVGLFDLATYTDAIGNVYQGIMYVGTYDDNAYDTRAFKPSALASERKTVQFVILDQLSNGSMAISEVWYFDIQQDGDVLLRTSVSGMFRLIVDGRLAEEQLYFDGHGKVTKYVASGIVLEGTCELMPEMGNGVYRFANDQGVTEFIFTLYQLEDASAVDGYVFEYAVYEAEKKGEYISDDWRYLSLNGFADAVYIDKYGRDWYGLYGYIVDNVVALYSFDGAVYYFEVSDDGSFTDAVAVDGFIIREHILYAYVGTQTEITIPGGVTHIAPGAFANSIVKTVHFNDVTNVGEDAFKGSLLEQIDGNNKILSVGKNAFANTYNLVTVALPLATDIGEGAFIGSHVKSVTLGAVQTVGNRAFALDTKADMLTLNLTNVENVTSITWGNDVFMQSAKGKLTGDVIYVRIVVKDVASVNALYAMSQLDAVKDSIGIDSEGLGLFFNFTDGRFYALSNGLVVRLVADYVELVAEQTLALYSVNDGNVTVYKFNGNGYDANGLSVGPTNNFTLDEQVFVAIGKEITLSTGSQNIALTVNFGYEWTRYDYSLTLKIDGTEMNARYHMSSRTIRYEENGVTMQLTVTGNGTCEIKKLGTLKNVDSDNEWRIVFIVAEDGTMTIDQVLTYSDEERWTEELVYSVVYESNYRYRIAIGVSGVTTEATPYLYYAEYTPGVDEKEEKLTVTYYGNTVKAGGDNGSVAYMVVDVFEGAIVELLSYNDGTQDYQIVSYTQEQDGSIKVVMGANGTNTKTYRITVTHLGYTDYAMEVVEINS